ncbi:nadh cytb-reductase [Trichoderma arundinaceum]|uniref:Nadh cytb-reductase n=1 Tax=Trichoderma arundinaceum TaxID=490622 RepID=A0A395NNG1_TRIAR|nr:nadh cytb-reductase [Trichoderma arundinaceum]
MAEAVEYTLQQIGQHNNRNDAWMIIHGEVYDVTKYIQSHPGGMDVLIEAAGTDASEAFDNAGHSDDAFDLMKPLQIGKLRGYKKKKTKAVLAEPIPSSKRNDSTSKEQPTSKAIHCTILSLGTAALYYGLVTHGSNLEIISKASLLGQRLLTFGPKLTVASSTVSSISSKPSFFKGLLVGAGTLISIHTLLARKLLNLILQDQSPRYPFHIKVPKPAEFNLLQQRGWLDSSAASFPIPLAKKELVSPNVYRLTFNLPSSHPILGLPTGQHVAITAVINGETVTRSYTPTSNNADKGILELLIKVYPDGKMTNDYLAILNIGDEVHFRGPKGAMRYSQHLCKKVGMIAGGTGITPMYQIIRAICESDRDTTEISLIYANKTEKDILLRQELDTFARRYPNIFKVYYVLENHSPEWTFGSGFVTKDMMSERFPSPSEEGSKVMICGPPGMVTAAKKTLVSLGYKQPGASGKMSDEIFVF